MTVANRWPATEAKAKFAEMLEAAEKKGPQTILKNGKRRAVLISAEEFDGLGKPQGSLLDFFAPLRGSGIKIERIRGKARAVKF